MVDLFDFGSDPDSISKEAASKITAAREEVERRGVKGFLFNSSSVEEFDQRADFGGVSDVLDDIADLYLGSPEQRTKLTSVLRKEFEVTRTPRETKTARRAVCPSCEGEGKYVNPSVDSQGLTADDFNEMGDDFADDYMSGAYDVKCSQCGGQGTVPNCSEPGCFNPAMSKSQDNGFGMGESRGRSSTEHYPNCYEHLDDNDRDDERSMNEMHAEMAAERAMGA